MKKVEFIVLPKYCDKVVKTKDPKYILLSYYLADRREIKFLETTIAEQELILSGGKTFEEVFDTEKFIIDIGYGAGEFECNKDTAYFISNNPEKEPSLELPLQELINTLKEWHSFLNN